jgi:hypothetical protein
VLLLFCAAPFRCRASLPLADLCNPNDSYLCEPLRLHSSDGFFRASINNSLPPTAEPAFEQTLRVNLADPSFELLSKAAFVVYNKKRGPPLLGANARNEYTFKTPEAFHDAHLGPGNERAVLLSTFAKLTFAKRNKPNCIPSDLEL